MDALDFLKAKTRMCKQTCKKCELWKNEILPSDGFCDAWMKKHPEKAVAFAEKWAAEHPIKTRQSVFFEQWPDARIKKADGLPMASPCDLDGKLLGKCDGISCPECRKKFWLTEVEE